jgi:hypothetical protein
MKIYPKSFRPKWSFENQSVLKVEPSNSAYDLGTRFREDCRTADGGARMTDVSDDKALPPFRALPLTAAAGFLVSMTATLLSIAFSTVAFTAAS